MGLFSLEVNNITKGGKDMPVSIKRNVFERSMLEKAPLRDYGFHLIFDPTTEDGRICLGFLLESICGIESKDMEVLLPRRNEGEKGDSKTTESDIRIKVNNEYHVVIEMQLIATMEFLLRSGYYSASEIVGQLSSGDRHITLKQNITINLIDEAHFKGNKKLKYIEHYRMRNERGEERIGYPYVYDVFIGKLAEKEIDYSKYDIETILAVFAQIMYNKNEEELKEKIKKYIMQGEGELMKGLDKIVDKVEYINNDGEREKLIQDYWRYQEQKGLERELKEEGRKEGVTEGKEEQSRIYINTMYSNGYSVEQIALALNLEKAYVESIIG